MLSISLILGGIDNVCYCMEFRSDQLEEMSKHIPLELPPCDSTFIARYDKHDIICRVSDDCMEHLGFQIFSEPMRGAAINPVIADFVERYWLSLFLPIKRLKSVKQQMLEDRFNFQVGSMESIELIQRDSITSFSCQATQNLVTLTWEKNDKTICCITFPVNHELIMGRNMPENDRRLPNEICNTKIIKREEKSIETATSLYPDSVTSLWVEDGGSYLDCVLESKRYYTQNQDSTLFEPIFNQEFIKESIVNLFTDYDIDKAENISLSIRHKIFGLKEQAIETTVPKFVAYAMQAGCVPFVGVISIDERNSGLADMLVIMHNRQIGYNHVLRVSVPIESISTGEGTAHARLNAFVPSSNIKNLFKN